MLVSRLLWRKVILVLIAAVCCQHADAALPKDAKVDVIGANLELEPLEESNGVLVAKAAVKITLPVPADATRVFFTAAAGGEKTALNAIFTWADRSTQKLFAKPADQKGLWDSSLELPWNLRLFVRPNMALYGNPDRKARITRGWEKFPPASKHLLKMELRRTPANSQVWIDGRFVQELPQKGAFEQVQLELPLGGSIKDLAWSNEKPSKFVILDIEHFARPATWVEAIGDLARPNLFNTAKVSVPAGGASIEGVPFRVAPAQRNVDLAGMGWLHCPSDDLVSFYWRRNTLDGLPEQCIVSVPQDTYACAHVLCASEDDPAKTPAFNLRLTRYANSRGDAMADTAVHVPAKAGGTIPNGKQVGTVTYGADAAQKTVPLWLIRVPLKSGLIQDLMREDEKKYCFNYPLPTSKYLDVELMDPLPGIEEAEAFPPTMQLSTRPYGPQNQRSAVHIFGVTLESSPAELIVRTNAPAYAFYAAENPVLQAEVIAREEGKFQVAWDFADVDQKIVVSDKRELVFSGGKLRETLPIPVAVGNGWYATRVRLLDAAGRELVDHRGSFVMLPPDTRKAGFESPHGTWWFNWAHGGAPDLERVGPLLQRAGLRHTLLGDSMPESASSRYGVTSWCVYWKQPKGETIEQWVADFEQHIRHHRKNWPNALPTVMLYHESDSYNARMPSEIWGEAPPPIAEKDDANWKMRMNHIVPWAKMIREKFPELKIQVGNAGDGCGMTAELLRRGFGEYIDYIAVEELGQTFAPERACLASLQSAWFLRETARKLGRPQAQITGCYEWIQRRNAALGLAGQAEWYARDVLHARAYGFHTIALGAIHDAGQGYFHTIWGNGGLCHRYPYMYPKPCYATFATLTRVLDSAKYERAVPSGSLSLYALEFKRGDQFVYALWTPRGCRETKLHFGGDAEAVITDLYGREKSVRAREHDLVASTAPQFVTSGTRMEKVTAGKAWFPEDAPPKNATIADPMAALAKWHVEEAPDKRLDRANRWDFPHRKQGKFELREVEDAEKGACLELELKPEGSVWDVMHEYAVLKLKEPVVIQPATESVGVWIKGNSGWGETIFEIEGADKKPGLIGGPWQGTHLVSFDGWNFMRAKLPANRTAPIKLTGIAVTLPRKMLYATEMMPVPELKIRLKDVSLF